MPIIVSKAHKMLLVPWTGGVPAMFPSVVSFQTKGTVFPDTDAALLNHDMRNTLVLRHLGFKVPNPLVAYYDWKGGKPFVSQKATVELLTENIRAYCLNHMGTGKTRAALWAWDVMHDAGLVGKLLIVAPLSTINFTWAREAFTTLPNRKVQVLHGTKARRIERLNEPADIYIINHDGLKVIGPELQARDDITVLVLDELAVYRNNSDRSKFMRTFATRFAVVWGMTGNPLPNSPTDVWAQCRIITPNTVPKYFRHAQEMLMKRLDQYRWIPKPDAVEQAFAMMQPAVRFTLDDVVELPELVSRTIDVELSPQQQKIYAAVVKELQVMVEDKQITALNAGAAMNKLLQIAGGWVYSKAPEFVQLDATPRTGALLDLINSNERKVIVLVPFRHMIDGLSVVLANDGIEHAVVHGDVSARDQIFYKFQSTSKYKVLLAHPECLAHGLTLTAADTVIWYSPTASLDLYIQANARITRVGQKHKQQLIHLSGTQIEARVYQILRRKERVAGAFLSLVEEATRAKTSN